MGSGGLGSWRAGRGARWKDEDIADTLTTRAVKFIEGNKDRPFFLYFATHDIHVPRVPHARFAGKSECGVRGDVMQELDWSVGEVMGALERLKLAENTVVIFSSDNGPVIDDGYADGAVKDLDGHRAAGPFRGGKYSIYEGGTRVPLIVNWPGKIAAGKSEALVSQVDLLQSFAAIAGAEVPANAGGDALDMSGALLGKSKVGRESLIEHAEGLALRRGRWKLVAHVGPAGKKLGGEAELYDLGSDEGETRNVAQENEGGGAGDDGGVGEGAGEMKLWGVSASQTVRRVNGKGQRQDVGESFLTHYFFPDVALAYRSLYWRIAGCSLPAILVEFQTILRKP